MVRVGSLGRVSVRSLAAVALVVTAVSASGGSAVAEDVSAALRERMDNEKEARRACKVMLCRAFAAPSVDSSEITCDVTKTWLAADIQARFLGNRLSWPWGHAQCKAGIAIDRSRIAAVMTNETGSLKLKKHNIACTLDHKDPTKGVAYTVKLSIEPTVQFEKGKAVKLSMGWEDIEAPTLAKGAIWSATKLDQAFNVMSSGIKKEINAFIYTKCAEEGIKVEVR